MLSKLLENRVLRYLVYGTSTVLISQAIYSVFNYINTVISKKSVSEFSEVIWTNELTDRCGGSANSQKSNKSNISLKRSQLVSNTKLCQNRYCADCNIGRLVKLIDETVFSLDLAMYTFTSHDLSNAIMRAFKRGVIVRLISDKEMVFSTGSQMLTLTKADVPVRFPTTTTNLMHHKFCILDGSARVSTICKERGTSYYNKRIRGKSVQGILMTGSLNWTTQGFGGNWENILITSNKVIVSQFEEEFERMWKVFAAKPFKQQ